jgi:hypothetical protein
MGNPVVGNAQLFPNRTLALVDEDRVIDNTWYKLLRTFFTRTGGGNGAPTFAGAVLFDGTNTQADGTQLIPGINFVNAAGGGVVIPALQAFQFVMVFALGGTANVFPPVGAQIDALSANASYALASGKAQIFWFQTTTQLSSTQLG